MTDLPPETEPEASDVPTTAPEPQPGGDPTNLPPHADPPNVDPEAPVEPSEAPEPESVDPATPETAEASTELEPACKGW